MPTDGATAQSTHQSWPCVARASRRQSLQMGRRHLGHGPLMRWFSTTLEQEAQTDRSLARSVDRPDGRPVSVRKNPPVSLKWGGTGFVASRKRSAVCDLGRENPSDEVDRGGVVASGIKGCSVLGPAKRSPREGRSSASSGENRRPPDDGEGSSGEVGGSAGRLSSLTHGDRPPTFSGASARNTGRGPESGGNMRSSSSTDIGLSRGSGSDGS